MSEGVTGVQRATRAGLWSAADLIGRQVVQFAASVALARLLSPAEFGAVALALFFSSLSSVFIQGGLAAALVQKGQTTRDEESAIFWLNLVASAVLAGVIVLASGAIARFFEQPVLQPLLVVAAAQLVIGALGAVQAALLTRDLAFATLAKVGMTATVLSSAVAVWAALDGQGVWALAWQLLLGAVIGAGGMWLVSPWRPRLFFRLHAITGLLRFGGWLSVASVMDVLYTQGVTLLVGKLHGVHEVGLYNRAATTQNVPSGLLTAILGRLALPMFSERKQDPVALRRGLRLANGFSMAVNLPAMVGLALLAPLVLKVAFGQQWVTAAPILSVLAIAGVLLPLHVLNLQALLALGRSDSVFRLEIVKKSIGLACIAVGSGFDVIGLAWAQVAASIAALFINVAPIGRLAGYGLGSQLKDLAALAGPTVVMAIIVLWLERTLPLPPLPLLLTLVGAGALAYLGAGLLFRLRLFKDGLEAVAGLLPRRRARRLGA